MAHFARIANGQVIAIHVLANPVLTDEDGNEQESLGAEFLANLHGGEPAEFVQTSYNGTIRFNYAQPGYTYDEGRDAFIPPKPFDSWVLNEETCLWEAPIPYPADGAVYSWDEVLGDWIEVTDETI